MRGPWQAVGRGLRELDPKRRRPDSSWLGCEKSLTDYPDSCKVCQVFTRLPLPHGRCSEAWDRRLQARVHGHLSWGENPTPDFKADTD